MSNPLVLKLATVGAISAGAMMSGAGLSLSGYAIPRILELPLKQQLVQWQKLYDSGKATFPPMAITPTIAYLYIAWVQRDAGNPLWTNYAISAALTIGIVPFTFAFILHTVHELEERRIAVEADQKVDAKESKDLVIWWSRLNVYRALLTSTGAILALWTALE